MPFWICFIVLFLFRGIDSHKILIITPTLTNSHILLNYRIGELLAQAGHDVTIFRPQYNPDATAGNANLTKEIRIQAVKNVELYREARTRMQTYFYNATNPYTMKMVKVWNELARNACREQIRDSALMDRLRKQEFDLAIVHNYDLCPMGMVHVLEIPSFIWLSCGILMDYMAKAIGVPSPPSYVPSLVTDSSDKMDFWHRTKNTLSVAAMNVMIPYFVARPMNQVFREEFGTEFPDLLELAGKAPLVFVNSEELIDFPRPILHKMVYIGGLGMRQQEQLPKKWQTLMDNAKFGAVLFSFGSVANSSAMPYSWKRAFLRSFSKFPDITFVWKYETEFPEAKKYKNIHLAPWVPQRSLLSHPKMIAFITHCGLNSMLEGAYAGVPMLALPLQGDQLPTRHRAEKRGIAIGLDKTDVSEDSVMEKLDQLFGNTTYLRNAKRLSSMLQNKPIKPEELLLNWVEFLGEFKELENLDIAGKDLTVFQYFLFDIFAGILAAAVVVSYLFVRICYCYYWWCFQTSFIKSKSD